MYRFLSSNYAELIARCKDKVSQRPKRAATPEQLANGIPLFLTQLINTLEAEDAGRMGESLRLSGASGGDASRLSVMGASATAHGKQLLELGYSVDQVVHDYGDICQAITDLAVERNAPFSVNEFRTLNRCLDNAIADAVTEFSARRDATLSVKRCADENARRGALVHELRNYLQTATLALRALETGRVALGGSTGALLKRSLASMGTLLGSSLAEVRDTARSSGDDPGFSLAGFIADAANAASLDAARRGCRLTVPTVDPMLAIAGDRDHLLAALMNLLQNALKFTHPHTEVTLHAYSAGERISIDVSDHCGGLPGGGQPGKVVQPLRTAQRRSERPGVGAIHRTAKRRSGRRPAERQGPARQGMRLHDQPSSALFRGDPGHKVSRRPACHQLAGCSAKWRAYVSSSAIAPPCHSPVSTDHGRAAPARLT